MICILFHLLQLWIMLCGVISFHYYSTIAQASSWSCFFFFNSPKKPILGQSSRVHDLHGRSIEYEVKFCITNFLTRQQDTLVCAHIHSLEQDISNVLSFLNRLSLPDQQLCWLIFCTSLSHIASIYSSISRIAFKYCFPSILSLQYLSRICRVYTENNHTRKMS